MIRIIFTDDDIPRTERFMKEAKSKSYFDLLQIDICYSADEARLKLINESDILVLDVLLPKKRKGLPDSGISRQLLEDICSKNTKYMRPKTIIGLTSDVESIDTHQSVFYSFATIILKGKRGEVEWLNNLFFQIESFVEGERKLLAIKKNKLLITIHGIRTYGSWQSVITSKVDDYSNEFNHEQFNYGYFDLLSFCIPFLRARKQNEIALKVINSIENSKDVEIDLIAHSFGTLIAKSAMEKYNGQFRTVIFCGSPLRSKTEISHIVAKSKLFINECGVHDAVLLMAKVFIPGLGDAGRKGFIHKINNQFINRFHIGGHSLYFDDNNDFHFVRSFWLPVLTVSMRPVIKDERRNFFLEDFWEFILSFFENTKTFLILLVFAFICFL
jgi:hypothetical protein